MYPKGEISFANRDGENQATSDLNNLYLNGNGHMPGASDMPTNVEKDILVRTCIPLIVAQSEACLFCFLAVPFLRSQWDRY